MRRRIILILLVIVIIGGGLFVVTKVRGSSGASGTTHTVTPRTTSSTGATIAAAGTPVRPVATPKPKPAGVTFETRALDQYAVGLVPILARGVGVFDRVTSQASSTSNLNQLSQLCFNSLKPLGIAQAQAEGVAHPYPWWTSVGKFHHSLLGIYHLMVGATDECSTAAGNGQAGDASVAVSIMSKEDSALKSVQSRVIAMSKGPK